MSGVKRALVLVAVLTTTVLLSPGNPPAMASPTSEGTTGTIHCC